MVVRSEVHARSWQLSVLPELDVELAAAACRPTVAVELGKLFVSKANREVFQSLVSRRTQQVRTSSCAEQCKQPSGVLEPGSACKHTTSCMSHPCGRAVS